ncbi:hypothetical protein OTK01_000328 [Caldicellulosiruptor acetigenus]|uniref:hypothetical protein n=1 Tax=Caldicellulosiruptor acetigenus TaxID=301953 RepID=UPI0022A983F5|nr:hypothetical protein [Caldicellulosiruptor acetigenus]WAM36554.1 hypothetical protein OTK01_000328 [Caldicellulosiruptor acetigenus]
MSVKDFWEKCTGEIKGLSEVDRIVYVVFTEDTENDEQFYKRYIKALNMEFDENECRTFEARLGLHGYSNRIADIVTDEALEDDEKLAELLYSRGRTHETLIKLLIFYVAQKIWRKVHDTVFDRARESGGEILRLFPDRIFYEDEKKAFLDFFAYLRKYSHHLMKGE